MDIDEVLTREVVNIIPDKEELKKLLLSDKKLNVYLGIDPTATKIHIGNAVPLRKLQKFVEMGHNVTFLIGDFTALIGDTSDKEGERPILTSEEITQNFQTYKKQAKKFLDFSKAKVRFNSEWLKKLDFTEIVKLCQQFTLGDFISRELIKKRLEAGKKVRFDETLYPVMQGYDSYFMNTDLQIGSADQTFNMQAGRVLQKKLRHKETFVLVTGYIMGTDGKKMSKSMGNAIWLEDTPDDIYGKVMSLEDSLIPQYLELATNLPIVAVQEKVKQLSGGGNPITIKKELAFQIVSELHGKPAAKEAQENFEKTFQERRPEYNLKIPLRETFAGTVSPFVSNPSVSAAKRLIKQGGVDVNDKSVTDVTYQPKIGDQLRIGSQTFGTVVEEK